MVKGKKKAEETESSSKPGNLEFIKAVARYFMDFLETDFHKRRAPKRYIKTRNKDNLLVGVNLKEYEAFVEILWAAINDGFNGKSVKIRKGVYQTPIPKDLLNLIKVYCEKLSQDRLDEIAEEIAKEIETAASLYEKEYDEAYNFSLQQVGSIFKKQVVLPLVEYLERPLEKLREADENTVYLLEEELTEGLVNFVDNKVSQLLNLLIHKEEVDTAKELQKYILIEEVRSFILTFFDNFRVTDLFSKLYELLRNKNILDKQELYLYFGDITFQKVKFPIFYIPIRIETGPDLLNLEFDSRVYINKKVLDYIRQEYNTQTGKKGSFSIETRILYLSQDAHSFKDTLQGLVKDIVNCFELDKEINLASPAHQISRSLLVRASNSVYLALFDKSDEAIINDYEEILNLEVDSVLVQEFEKLLEDFVHQNPKSFETDLENEWDELNTEEKLVFKTPIPLNSEQYKILSALKKSDCRYVVVEGPPGTGKSHSISAVVFNAILNGQSVLVLSDKKEALDVVEDKISSTMDKVRIDKNFQNPILRLGRTGNTYNQILSSSSISKIEDNVKAVRRDLESLKQAIDQNLDDLKEAIEAEIGSYDEIDLEAIIDVVSLSTEIEHLNQFFDLAELEALPDSFVAIESLVSNLKKIGSTFSEDPLRFDLSHKVTAEIVAQAERLLEAATLLRDLKSSLGEDVSFPPFSLQALSSFESDASRVQTLLEIHSEAINTVCEADVVDGALAQFRQCDSLSILLELKQGLLGLQEVVSNVRGVYKEKLSILRYFEEISSNDIEKLRKVSAEFIDLRNWLFGYLGKGERLEKATIAFRKSFPRCSIEKPHKYRKKLSDLADALEYLVELEEELHNEFKKKISFFDIGISLLASPQADTYLETALTKLSQVENAWLEIEDRDWRKELREQVLSELQRILWSFRFHKESEAASKAYSKISHIISVKALVGAESLDGTSLYSTDLFRFKEYIATCLDFLRKAKESAEQLLEVKLTIENLPKSAALLRIDCSDFNSILNNRLSEISDADLQKLLNYLESREALRQRFEDVDPVNYLSRKREIEELVTAQMTYLMDERIVNFSREFKSEARVLRQIIRQKKQFPREQFSKLKEAFPCILAGIRDYAEYIPLEPEIFDLVIIDEASQVSIAQAFPALLRAKKVLVLGDQKQFSNVKSAHARTDYNKEYQNRLEEVFREHISEDLSKLEKLKKFDIKTSILDFFAFINNYRARLLKHFRGYKEIIAYSNKYFYQGTLQVMKIRGKPASEVLKFKVLDHDGKIETKANTNLLEVEFIISELKKLYEAESKISIGIITPHTNQQKLINEKINELPERDFYFDHLRLKIMTFDTCQGEERELIFYSMVATRESDKLNYIFIKDLDKVDLEEEGLIRAQRLNVGFSRAKECMFFVLSKPVEEFSGEIGNALNYYQQQLIQAQKERDVSEVDSRSKMEERVLHYFYQTSFWTQNSSKIELAPQFEIGEYLKQLDPTYSHPNYRVDFLVLYTDAAGDIHKIIIEYDGFHEHFKGAEGISADNYESYYCDEDVYRQKVLQGYGYKFLRINRFNIGDDPIATLNARLEEIVETDDRTASVIQRIKKKIVGLEDGSMKQCPKCSEVLPHEAFYDESLVSNYGRFCKSCKSENRSKSRSTRTRTKTPQKVLSDMKCPRCSSGMVLRKGKYGKFYGCSRFPGCRGTRRYR